MNRVETFTLDSHAHSNKEKNCMKMVDVRSLVPRPHPVFSILHAEKREGLVDLVM